MDENIQGWIDKANEDWLTAEWILKDDSPVTTPALFHLQQCVEKLIKGYLTKISIRFEKKHDLIYLLSLAQDKELNLFHSLLNDLNVYAVEIRYPGELPVISRNEAKKYLNQVAEFRDKTIPLITD